MPNYIFSLQQRLAGNIYENRYFVNATDAIDGAAIANDIISAHAQLQTADVEYVGALLTLAEGDHVTTPVEPVLTRGSAGGDAVTLPGGTFLEFVFYSVAEKGKVTHRVRGCASSSATELGVFNVNTSGSGDPDADGTATPLTAIYRNYADAIAGNSLDQHYSGIIPSYRVSVGFKRATRRL